MSNEKNNKMRVLWLSSSPGVQSCHKTGYNGGGWIPALQREIMRRCPEIELAIAFISPVRGQKEKVDGCTYYPIYAKPKSRWEKLCFYYGGYKHRDGEKYVAEMQEAIKDYQPDIIHLYGLECELSTIVGKTDAPLIAHLQGFLLPYQNAFWPEGMNERTFLYPFSLRETLLRNGYVFAHREMKVRAENERKLFRRMRYCMGRTLWDYEVSRLMSPDSKYFHVDEMLRPVFYELAGKWQRRHGKKFVISSTISQTVYKGLDLVMKTAALLAEETDLDFEWRVVGVDGSSEYVRFFERNTHVRSGHIHYMGILDAGQLAQNLLETDLYVHPSYIDNSPNSVCEAQLLGVPVAACYVGGVSSLIKDGVSGLLVPANAPFELAYHIKRLAHDEELCRALSRNGHREASDRHDKEKILSDLTDTYREVIRISRNK